ncbi:NAD(P)-binding protein [Morchella conica CCBAS932]|uniref:3-dehydrosphinganine reductase n=1 Tax=Morchella conica CCBAS932 TaxID=1392247 RepID=A0A3N4KM46_9PEZI|nr:NAD(P)-binding protein [Morchella conica CCBAS932]
MPFPVPSASTLTIAAATTAAVTIPPTIYNMFWGENKLPVEGRLVVITGGSQGMGLSVAKLLSKKGASIAIVARNPTKLASALAEIEACALHPGTQTFHAVSADLTQASECARMLDEIRVWGGVPDIVWTCAGFAVPGFFKDLSAQQLEEQVRTNYFSVMFTAHAAINMMMRYPLRKGVPRRHLVFTSTVMAFYTIAGYNAYSPAKAAIRTLADGLRQECILYDIDVHCCFPATIYSPGFEVEQTLKPELTKILEGSDEGQTPDVVAEACVKGLEKGQSLVVTNMLGEAMRSACWGGSPRGCWWWDTLLSWVVAVVWLVLGRMMDGDVHKYVKKHGIPMRGKKAAGPREGGIGGPGERTQMFL